MAYEVGTFIDLSGINKRSGGSTLPSKSTTNLVSVGTSYIFRLVEGRLVAALQIPVMAA